MLTKTILAAGALMSVAAAVPMQQHKRDVVWTTQVDEAYVTVDVTTTIWLNPGETPPAAPAGEAPGAPGHFGHHGHHGHKPKTTSIIMSTVSVPRVAPSSPAAPSSPPENTETYAPPPTTTAAPPPDTWSAPASTPTTAAAPPPKQTPPSNPSPGGGSPGGGGSGGGSGDLTYYTPGLGSCGVTNTASQNIVALAEGMMEARLPANGNPNDNPLCGKSITISWQGKTATATIMDTCPGCENGGLDLTPTLFQQFAPLSEGRLTGMTWTYN